MKIRVPNYFKDFQCIASKCEDTCCAGWGIAIDEETYNKYINVKGPFGDRLRREIVEDGADKIFTLNNNNCSFLNENKLCDIYKELGEDSLCYTCRQYPRYMEQYDELREMGISLSCPEAARIILSSSEQANYEMDENDEVNDFYSDVNIELYEELVKCREIVFDILYNRNIELKKRAAVILKFADDIQQLIDNSMISSIIEVRERYANEDYIISQVNSLDEYEDYGSDKYDIIFNYFKVYIELKHLTEDDPMGLNDAFRYFWNSEEDEELYLIKHRDFNSYYKGNEYKFENILGYFVYRYFTKAVFDYDLSSKVKFAIVSYIMIKELAVIRFIENNELTDEDIVELARFYSKDIEHLEENVEKLYELYETEDDFNIEEIILVLMN